ncbi:GNAT family N-acetyltransferase [Cellvibrio mixtus]|uniref:GNAT family N-acetyltransferase n=1 Tax=Cellvibrio mixtus TaxID=39650 RepID=A0A266Q9D0_9GAMM|nr:GNAT family N-acetyltransferase [Cellvibrio mixtus]OZY86445.1 GNAT family N-acetyltransferase [Cellvibrio mixtus]
MCSIRRATKDDAEAIANLYRELNTLSPVSVSPERIDAVANSDNTYLLVCDDAGEIIATALVCLCQDVMFENQPFALVENVVVRADCKREGIGKNMMDYIEAFCLEQDCSKIMLQTSSGNQNARDFYTTMGYNPNTKIGFIKYRRYFSR